MDRKLEMIFINAAGRKSTLSVYNAREDITEEEVQAAMDLILDSDIFITNGGDIVAVSSARIVATEVTEIPVE